MVMKNYDYSLVEQNPDMIFVTLSRFISACVKKDLGRYFEVRNDSRWLWNLFSNIHIKILCIVIFTSTFLAGNPNFCILLLKQGSISKVWELIWCPILLWTGFLKEVTNGKIRENLILLLEKALRSQDTRALRIKSVWRIDLASRY